MLMRRMIGVKQRSIGLCLHMIGNSLKLKLPKKKQPTSSANTAANMGRFVVRLAVAMSKAVKEFLAAGADVNIRG